MKIHANQIPQEGLFLNEFVNSQDLSLDFNGVEFTQPVGIKADVYKITNTVTLNLEIKSKVIATCSRCLKKFDIDISKKLAFSYPEVKPQDVIDPASDIREELIIDFPIKLLCREDCKGLCPKCGKDRNSEKCNCI